MISSQCVGDTVTGGDQPGHQRHFSVGVVSTSDVRSRWLCFWLCWQHISINHTISELEEHRGSKGNVNFDFGASKLSLNGLSNVFKMQSKCQGQESEVRTQVLWTLTLLCLIPHPVALSIHRKKTKVKSGVFGKISWSFRGGMVSCNITV